ncbi:hypothetical protein H4S02_006370 [Coemansia sp. RSA 2611]|nr:hypothetical protein H4S01_004181 [Coemansia sp. RSA 2610]KAJ2381097.1 hypothetical protein H4S02_006370 [Coemansia sp. RSA 2611]
MYMDTYMQPDMSLFGHAYEQVAAGLCDEEAEQIRELVQDHMYTCSKQEIYAVAIGQLPLCRASDVTHEVDRWLIALASEVGWQAPSAQAESHPATKQTGVWKAKAWKAGAPMRRHADDTDGRWTPMEEEVLEKYLHDTYGCRKNWVHCARLVGTKSSAQCKSKFHNDPVLRAAWRTR